MSDAEFLDAFLGGALNPTTFDHASHVRVAFLLLDRHSPAEALSHLSQGLKRFAASAGKAGKYHETITWAFFALIAERKAQSEPRGWDAFRGSHPDLLTPALLDGYYAKEQLASPLARSTFILPRSR